MKGSGRSAAEALKLGLWSEAVSKGKRKGMKRKIKLISKAIAALTLRGMIYFDLPLKKLLPPEPYDSVHRSVFSSIAKFVLTVFDLEDFERIFNWEKLSASYRKLRVWPNRIECVQTPSSGEVSKRSSFPFKTCGYFGRFDAEVLDVIEVAYIQRRMQGHRFIGIEHFLFGLSLSRVGKPVQRFLDDKGLRLYVGKHSEVELPLYKIYDLSTKAAMKDSEEVLRLEHFAKDSEEVVRLEHFALAVIASKLQEDPPS
ncbi:hypothetical protein RHSIM_Rhsim10G0029500 [Rhododendron simsii]|uniref:Clp R domain-containing protein n=1 Tax=Rhododendron simsii TaxID=118357 RepID=A0A834GDE0_RHOSS|nr:hypothetical protein RHSIM_Rhsim10G0029500 [Rhododendron simsii]